MKEIKYDKDKENFIDILKNVHVLSLKYKRNDYMSKKLSDIELKIEKENPSIKEKYITYLSGDYQKITEIVDKIKEFSNRNYFSLSQCIEHGITRYEISQLQDKGLITKVKYGLYAFSDILVAEMFGDMDEETLKALGGLL